MSCAGSAACRKHQPGFLLAIHNASVLVMHYTGVQSFSRSCQIDNSYIALRNFLRLRFL